MTSVVYGKSYNKLIVVEETSGPIPLKEITALPSQRGVRQPRRCIFLTAPKTAPFEDLQFSWRKCCSSDRIITY